MGIRRQDFCRAQDTTRLALRNLRCRKSHATTNREDESRLKPVTNQRAEPRVPAKIRRFEMACLLLNQELRATISPT